MVRKSTTCKGSLHRQNDAINTNYMAKAQNQPSRETPKVEWEENGWEKLAGKNCKGVVKGGGE